MISTYYTNNVAADENFLDHMYRIVSDHFDFEEIELRCGQDDDDQPAYNVVEGRYKYVYDLEHHIDLGWLL